MNTYVVNSDERRKGAKRTARRTVGGTAASVATKSQMRPL
jgi:hypothetical protein